MGRILTVEQAADMLQLNPQVVREYLRKGKLPGRKIGRHWRIPEDDLSASLRAVPAATKGERYRARQKPGNSEDTREAQPLLDEIVRRIREAADPERVILFGSRARGDAGASSDFDVLVVKESDQPRYRRSAPLFSKLSDLPVEVEVVVYTPGEIAQWRNVPQAFITRAIREGKVLYERPR